MSSKFSLSTVAFCFLGAAFAAVHAKRSDYFTPLQLPLTSLPEWTHVVNVTIGTPGQNLPMIISTIHYHTWVPNADSEYCDAAGYHENKLNNGHHNIKPFPSVCRWGSFNSSLSKTYVDRTPNDQNTALFQWFHEIFEGVLEDNGGNINGMNFTDRLEAGDILIRPATGTVANALEDAWAKGLSLPSHFTEVLGGTVRSPDRNKPIWVRFVPL